MPLPDTLVAAGGVVSGRGPVPFMWTLWARPLCLVWRKFITSATHFHSHSRLNWWDFGGKRSHSLYKTHRWTQSYFSLESFIRYISIVITSIFHLQPLFNIFATCTNLQLKLDTCGFNVWECNSVFLCSDTESFPVEKVLSQAIRKSQRTIIYFKKMWNYSGFFFFFIVKQTRKMTVFYWMWLKYFNLNTDAPDVMQTYNLMGQMWPASLDFDLYALKRPLVLVPRCDLGCCLIPCLIDDLKDVTHTCPYCKGYIYTYKRIC